MTMIDVGTVLSIAGVLLAAGRKVPDIKSFLEAKPSAGDRKKLRSYVKKLNEHRVFYVPMNAERANAVVYSLSEVKTMTEGLKAEIEHEGLKMAIGAILDHVRAFLDSWAGREFVRTGDDRAPENVPFLVALGELRLQVRRELEIIQAIWDKDIKPDNIIPSAEITR